MIRRFMVRAGMLALLAAVGCDGSTASPKIQGDPPPNQVKPLPLAAPPGPARPAIKTT